MFGFLKKKLQEAVSRFSKSAKDSVSEQPIEDAASIAQAQQEEAALVAVTKEHVEEIAELPREQAQHAREEKAGKDSATARAQQGAPERSEERRTPDRAKPVPHPKTIAAQEVRTKTAVAAQPSHVKTPQDVPTPLLLGSDKKTAERRPEPVLDVRAREEPPAAKKGFLRRVFAGREPKETTLEEKRVLPEEITAPASIRKDKETEARPVLQTPHREETKTSLASSAEQPEVLPTQPTFLRRIAETFTKKTLSEEKFETLFWELEVVLLENNVAVEVIEKIKADLKKSLTSGKVTRLGIEELISLNLRKSVKDILDVPTFDLVERVRTGGKRPFVIAFIGVNGSGKTTTLAKIANLFQNEELSVVLAASDTFRAAAIDQLKEHADKLGVKLISQGYGADPAAVAFDAIEHAKARGIDVVMIDTAGRLHSNTNLMSELQKVIRVSKPDLKIFIGESVTGNDCIEQAKEFDRLVGIDAIILSKVDVDEKGGAALSVSYVTRKPILYLGVGQAYGDLRRFEKEEIVRTLGL
jgi:fused signal recognition particle receptor